MAIKGRIVDHKDIKISDLTLGREGQVRVSETGKDIDELAQSIEKTGLLQSIVVGPSATKGKYEIIIGQRRFLAHKQLGLEKIRCAILDRKLSEVEAKVLSVSENIIRTDLPSKDLKDVCTFLYNKYGTKKDVHAETGIPTKIISKYVRYDRLPKELKKMVDDGKVDINNAIDANDAVWDEEQNANEKRVELAITFAGMITQHKKRTAEIVKKSPGISVKRASQQAKKQISYTVKITQGPREYEALKKYAIDYHQRMEEAAAELVEEALRNGEYLQEDED